MAAQYPAPVSISRDGSRILLKTNEWNTERLSVVDRLTKRTIGTIESPNAHLALSWSSNRNEIAYLSAEGNGDNFHPFVWKTDELRPKPLDGPVTNTAIQSIRWSPDGERLAYLVGNNGEATIWILAVHGPAHAHLLVEHVRTLTDFEWSPDGKSIAAVLRNAPFVLQIISADSGAVLNTVPVGRGPASEIRDMSWASSGQAVALSARVASDYFALFRVEPKVHGVVLCNSAAGDIVAPHFASDSQEIVYSMSVDSQVSLHSTRCDSSKPATIWSRPGTVRFLKLESRPLSSKSNIDSVFLLHTSLEEPPSLYRLSLGAGTPEMIYASPNASRLRATAAEIIDVPSGDGSMIPTVFWKRSGTDPDSNIVLVDVHGGPRLQQYRRWEFFSMALTRAGVDVLSPNYRGSGGYGYRFERVDANTQIKDIVAVCKYAKSLHGRKTRVILMGTSYGAYLAASAAVSDVEDISGVVLVSMIPRGAERPFSASWMLPLVCFHGENDSQPPDRARLLIESFFGSNVFQRQKSQWHVFAGEGHVFRLTSSWAEVYGAVSTLAFNLSSPPR